MRSFTRTLVAAAVVVMLLGLAYTTLFRSKDEKPDILFVPTAQEVVDKMLEVAKVSEKDVVYDLGCGDGRIVCTAAKTYKAKSFGFDVDSERIKDSEKNKAKLDKDIQKLVT